MIYIKITIITNNKVIERFYNKPVLLQEALSDCGISISYPCGGKGICKGCAVSVVGDLSPVTETEKSLEDGLRLACRTKALGDTVITVLETGDIEGVMDLYLPNFTPSNKKGFGTVTDIGTTTVSTYLFNLNNGKYIDSVCLPNPQIQYGADVISRIDYARKNGNDILTSQIRKTVKDMLTSFGCVISESVILGNTAMLHLYNGYSTDGMATAPFNPTDLFGKHEGNIYFPKCISAFIGADTVCAIIAADFYKYDTALLLDIGTNCEMVLWNKGSIYCCSSAAGPAFEGAGISCGVPSIKGAINKVYIKDGYVKYTTIGNEEPCGICGSGLIDAASCMIKTGFMDTTGFVDGNFYLGDSGFFLTQKDIRQLQLAKAAVMAGIEALLAHAKISFSDVEKIYLAGGFGSRIDVLSCEQIMLLPKNSSEKTLSLGNAAASGGIIMLMQNDIRKTSEKISEQAITVSLADDKVFSEAFIKYISFQALP